MQILPYLYFDGDCEVAFRFYERCLGGRIEEMVTHAGTPVEQQVPAEWRSKILHARLTVGDVVLMASDVQVAAAPTSEIMVMVMVAVVIGYFDWRVHMPPAQLGPLSIEAITPGSLVRVDIADSVLYGFIAHSEEWPVLSKPSFARNKVWSDSSADAVPERRLFHTGIEVVEVAMGTSGLSQLLKTTLEEALPDLEITFSAPA